MGALTVRAVSPETSPDEAIARIARFAEYPKHSDAVLNVDVLEDADGVTVSKWEVQFRRGILRWVERADHDLSARRIHFSEISGDIDEFTGWWAVKPHPEGALVEFAVEFDIGIPTLDHILDPIAEAALLENLQSILRGLFGDGLIMIEADGSTRRWSF